MPRCRSEPIAIGRRGCSRRCSTTRTFAPVRDRSSSGRSTTATRHRQKADTRGELTAASSSGASVNIDAMAGSTSSHRGTQIDLAAWAQEFEEERKRLEQANKKRAARRGYLVFATDPELAPDDPGYREVFATEA